MAFVVEPFEDDPRSFHLVGELDLATVERLLARLGPVAETPGDLHLEASRLTFVDSSGLHALVRLARKLDPHRSRLILHRVDPFVRHVLSITGLDRQGPFLLSEDAPPGPSPSAEGLAGPDAG